MIGEFVRDRTRGILERLARFVGRGGISPNFVTVVGFLLSVAAGCALAWGHFLAGALLLALSGIMDGLDGALARTLNLQSRFGAFFDSTLDRLSEIAVYFGLMLLYLRQGSLTEPLLIYAAITGSLMVSYTRARGEGLGVSIREGVFTRFERLAVLALGLLTGYVQIALWALAILSNLTALQRVLLIRRAMSDRGD